MECCIGIVDPESIFIFLIYLLTHVLNCPSVGVGQWKGASMLALHVNAAMHSVMDVLILALLFPFGEINANDVKEFNPCHRYEKLIYSPTD